jgi:hypothetical protein
MRNSNTTVSFKADTAPGSELWRRKPQRVTTTMSWGLHQRLQQRADEEGRSLSNLVNFLLEAATTTTK